MRFARFTLKHDGGTIYLDTDRIISFQSGPSTDITKIVFNDTSEFQATCEVTERIEEVAERVAIAFNAALKVGS